MIAAPMLLVAKELTANTCLTDHRRHTNDGPLKFYDGVYIHFNMTKFQHACPPLVEETNIESFTMQFNTNEDQGLIWLDKRPDLLMYLAVVVSIYLL